MFKKLLTLIVILVAVALAVWFFVLRQKNPLSQNRGEDLTYQTSIPFDPETLPDISESSQAKEVVENFQKGAISLTIPGKSKLFMHINTYCMDSALSAPDSDRPLIFSYEKADMPMFEEITEYVLAHPELDPHPIQAIYWGLGPTSRFEFESFDEDEQAILLDINPNAQEIIDNYEYHQNITAKAYDFGDEVYLGENEPDQVYPQRIPGTDIYIKLVDVYSFSGFDAWIYNPTNSPQTFSRYTSDGILSVVAATYSTRIEFDYGYMFLVLGKLDISDGNISTPADSKAVLISGAGGLWSKGQLIVILQPNTQISPENLEIVMEEVIKASGEEPISFVPVAKAQETPPPVIISVETRAGGTIIVTRLSDGTVIEYHVPSGRSRTYRDCSVTGNCGTSLSLELGNAWAKITDASQRALLTSEEYQRLNMAGPGSTGVRGMIPYKNTALTNP